MPGKYKGIALSGKAGAGKDVIAQAIDDYFVVSWVPSQIMKLAEPIYKEAYDGYGMSRDVKDRPLLQKIGDERTSVEPSYYARLLVEKSRRLNMRYASEQNVQPYHQRGDDYQQIVPIVTDMRKVIEAEYLRQAGFALVRLDADLDVRRARLLTRDGTVQEESFSHWTESDLDYYNGWHIRLPNNGELTPQWLGVFISKALGFIDEPEG